MQRRAVWLSLSLTSILALASQSVPVAEQAGGGRADRDGAVPDAPRRKGRRPWSVGCDRSRNSAPVQARCVAPSETANSGSPLLTSHRVSFA